MEVKDFSFSFVYNLKKNGFNFTNDHMKSLTEIGFKTSDFINQNNNKLDLEFMSKMVSYKDSNNIPIIKEFLTKNSNFLANHLHLKCFYDNIQNNYLAAVPSRINFFSDLYKLYEMPVHKESFANNYYMGHK